MSERGDEVRRRKPEFHATWVPSTHAKICVSHHFTDAADAVVNAYTKLDAIAALISAAGHYPSTNFGDRAVGIGLILEDISQMLKVAIESPGSDEELSAAVCLEPVEGERRARQNVAG